VKAFVEGWVESADLVDDILNFYRAVICVDCRIKKDGVIPASTKYKRVSEEIIVAKPRSLKDLRELSKGRRIEAIYFGKETLRYLDENEINLIEQTNKAVVIDVGSVIRYYKSLRDLKEAVSLLLVKWIPTLFSCSPLTRFDVCHSHQVVQLIASLGFEAQDVEALWALGSNWAISLYERKRGMRRVLRSER